MMQSFNGYAFVCVSTVASALAIGCGDSTPPRTGPATTSSVSSSSGAGGEGGGSSGGMGGTGGTAGSGGMGSGGSGGGTGGNGGGTGGSGGSVEMLSVVDVADSACNDVVGSFVELYADQTGAPAFSRLAVVNGRRLASGRFARGFITFNLDGTGKSSALVGLDPEFDIAVSEGNTIGLVTDDAVDIRFQRYASNDSAIGSPIQLSATYGSGHAIAGDGAGGSLVVWASSNALNGRYVDSAGNVMAPFTFANGSSTQYIATSLARGAGGFALAWSAKDGATSRIKFARLSTTGIVGSVVSLPGTLENNTVVKLVAMSSGYALLLQSGQFALDSIVARLDADGNVIGSARRYLGTQYAWDLAVNGSNLGLIAKRSDDVAEMRPLDSNGDPIGDWKCLDGPSQDVYDQAGIDADGAGWAIVYRTPGGGEKFVRTNLMGTAAP